MGSVTCMSSLSCMLTLALHHGIKGSKPVFTSACFVDYNAEMSRMGTCHLEEIVVFGMWRSESWHINEICNNMLQSIFLSNKSSLIIGFFIIY